MSMDAERDSDPPSVWVFTLVAAGSSLTPLINRALGDPISGEMHSMLLVAGIGAPLVSLLYLLGDPSVRDRVGVGLTLVFGGGTLLWVDWSRIDGRIFVLAVALVLVPTLVRLASRR